MIGIVVSGHLNFATGIKSALSAITGDSEQIAYVDFLESMSTADLEAELRNATCTVNSDEGVLFLTDIPGGSPFQRSAVVAQELASADVISGTNLVMAAEACLEREELTLAELSAQVIETGRDNIKSLMNQPAVQPQPAEHTEAGGI